MSFLFRRRDPGSRHVYRYGPLRITCVDRDVPIDVRVNAHLMYKVVLSWEDKARCATPFDMIARKAVDMILDARAGSVARPLPDPAHTPWSSAKAPPPPRRADRSRGGDNRRDRFSPQHLLSAFRGGDFAVWGHLSAFKGCQNTICGVFRPDSCWNHAVPVAFILGYQPLET